MKTTIKKISLFMLSLAVVLTMAASTGMNSEAASKKPTKITLKATSKTVDIKGKVKVSVKSVKPSNASKSVTYKSSNKKIATVSSKGTVTGKKKGTVKITATSKTNKKVKSTIKITVKGKPTKITLKATSKTVDIKGKVKVSVKSVKPSNASKSVTYKSSNKKIATVSSKGTVTGKKKGTVKITATSKTNKKVKSTIKITVKDLKASSVKLNTTSKTVASGKTTTLKATVKGTTGFYNQGVTWKSSNTKVATVTSKGVVKGIAAGQATITATEKGGSKKATCLITVTEPVKVDTEAGTVTLKGILNASAFKKPTMHYLVTANLGASGGNPIFTGLNDRIDLANALDSLGATAWNTNSKTVLANGESIAAVKDKKGTNANYSKLNISVSWAGHDAVAMQDTIKNADKSAYTGTIVYANSGAVQKAIPSGCEICTSSCYAGICASEDVAMGGTTIGNSANLPKAGTVVTITIAVDGYKAPYNYISKEELKADIDGKQEYKILDVRQAAKYAESHIAGAVSADVDGAVSGTDVASATKNIEAAIKNDPAGTKYAVVCNSGSRYAQAATEIMIKAGISNKNIFTLTGGMKKDAGGWDYDNYCVKSYTSDKSKTDFTHGMTVNQLKANIDDGKTPFVVFDLRDVASYATGHIKPSISTPLRESVDGALKDLSDDQSKANLQAAVNANPNKFYVVECYSGNNYAAKAVNYLKEIGVSESKIIVLEGGAKAWKDANHSTIVGLTVSAADLKADIDSTQSYKLIDARKAEDYAKSHIVGAVSADQAGAVSGSDKATAAANVEKAIAGDSADQKYTIICYSGNRYAEAAASTLVEKGVNPSNIYTLKGGMGGWTEANYLVKSYKSTSGFDFVNGMTVDQLKANLEAGNTPFVVFDLRDAVTYAAGHIDGAVSTPLRENNGADLSDETSKANLEAAVKANPNKFYVVECYSGNKYANKSVNYLKALGVSEGKIIVLEGGASAWNAAGNTVVKSTVPVSVDKANKTISVYGVLNGKYLEEPTKHYMSTTGCSLGNQCLFEGLCDRLDFADAMAELGGTPWNTTPGGHKIKSGEYITPENGDNKDYTHVDVNVSWGDKTVSMADTLTSVDGSPVTIDEVFSNSKDVSASYKSGCLLCTCSCYAGVVTNEDMPFVSGADIKTMGNKDVLPKAGTVVKITVTLK